jgi:hypothetical protein
MKLILAALVAHFCASAGAANVREPDVVFITDDHRQLDSRVYGSTEVCVPNVAKLAPERLKFAHASVASPSCTRCELVLPTDEELRIELMRAATIR